MRPTLSYGSESWTIKSDERTYQEKCILRSLRGTPFWITKEMKVLRENYRIKTEHRRNCKEHDQMSPDRLNFF
jgi:hypothetical protein